MKVLITGASGFLGCWLAQDLTKRSISVRGLVRANSNNCHLQKLNLELVQGDVTDINSLIRATKGVDIVFHLAGIVGYKPEMRELMEQVNVNGTRNLIKACQNSRVKKLIHVSSVATIGASLDGQSPLTEESQYNLTTFNLGYFETKLEAERLVLASGASGFLNTVAVNPATIYGAGDAKKGSRKTQVKVAKGKFPFYSHGGVNIVSVHDLVEGIFSASQRGRCGERYIMGGENILIKDLFAMIAQAAGVNPPSILLGKTMINGLARLDVLLSKVGLQGPVNSESARISTLFHWFDSAKAKNELGLKSRPAKACILESVQWMKDNQFI